MTLREPRHLVWNERLSKADKQTIDQLNGSLDRLDELRAVRINVTGRFCAVKDSLDVGELPARATPRIIALMDGAVVAWNHRCTPLGPPICPRIDGDDRCDGGRKRGVLRRQSRQLRVRARVPMMRLLHASARPRQGGGPVDRTAAAWSIRIPACAKMSGMNSNASRYP
jgi:hypothetical protein